MIVSYSLKDLLKFPCRVPSIQSSSVLVIIRSSHARARPVFVINLYDNDL